MGAPFGRLPNISLSLGRLWVQLEGIGRPIRPWSGVRTSGQAGGSAICEGGKTALADYFGH